MLLAWFLYILDVWMAFVLSASSPMVSLETSKKKVSKDKQDHATLSYLRKKIKNGSKSTI